MESCDVSLQNANRDEGRGRSSMEDLGVRMEPWEEASSREVMGRRLTL